MGKLIYILLVFPLFPFSQPLQQPLPKINTKQFQLPEPPHVWGLLTIWPTSRLKFTASLGINTNMLPAYVPIRPSFLGYDIRLKFYPNQQWRIFLRHQTMYITSNQIISAGAIYRIPPHKKPKSLPDSE